MRVLALLCCLASAAQADPLLPVSWEEATRSPHRLISFDTLPEQAEPGHILNAALRFDGLWLGERLAGQTQSISPDGLFDQLTGRPRSPLQVLPGKPAQNMAIAQHRGFGSMALFPLGPKGAQAREGRGEGALAFTFDSAQTTIAFRLHADYPAALGTSQTPGPIRITFYDRKGALIEEQRLTLPPGVQSRAWQSATPVKAVTISNRDPGGIALDDILIQTDPDLG
ncbi:MAG: hypothetical protein QNJ09_03455 [Paracoccaceae bacterium]|nr:hypothetical protein [Paracoccaceae bacterium]